MNRQLGFDADSEDQLLLDLVDRLERLGRAWRSGQITTHRYAEQVGDVCDTIRRRTGRR